MATSCLEALFLLWLASSDSRVNAKYSGSSGGAMPEILRLLLNPTKDFHMSPYPDRPLILIGPVTGVAPFVGFPEHRRAVTIRSSGNSGIGREGQRNDGSPSPLPRPWQRFRQREHGGAVSNSRPGRLGLQERRPDCCRREGWGGGIVGDAVAAGWTIQCIHFNLIPISYLSCFHFIFIPLSFQFDAFIYIPF